MHACKFGVLGAALHTILLVPLPATASTITLPFSLTVSPAATLVAGASFNFFDSTPFAQFNPAMGTFNSVSVSLTGNATWTESTGPASNLEARLGLDDTNIFVSNVQTFTMPGAITLNLSYAAAAGGFGGAVEGTFVGTGTTHQNLALFTAFPGETFATQGSLTGTVTYDFTPGTPVPEPGSVALLAAGISSVVYVRAWRAGRRGRSGRRRTEFISTKG
jgi:hypothetical protein